MHFQLFENSSPRDEAFDARIAVVRGLLERSQQDRAKAMLERLNVLKTQPRISRSDVMELQDLEVEAAIYAEPEALYGIYLRTKDRCWRLHKSTKDTWVAELDRLFSDPAVLTGANDAIARKRLALVGREINAGTAEFVRKTAEKARVLFRLSGLCCLLIVLFLGACIYFARTADTASFIAMVPPIAFAGGIGASISALRGMRNEKLRDENLRLLWVQYFIRSFLGLFYASFVLACVTTGMLPLKIPPERLAFLLALGFVSGFTDSLFDQTVSRFTQPSEQNEAQ